MDNRHLFFPSQKLSYKLLSTLLYGHWLSTHRRYYKIIKWAALGVCKVEWNMAYNSAFCYNGGCVFVGDENIIEVNAASKEPKVKSLKEAVVILEDVTEYFTSENLEEMVNDLGFSPLG